MPNSMTGFARSESQPSWGSLNCEIRSVNHRYLEPSIRLDDSLRVIEPIIRDTLRKHLSRGKVDIHMQLRAGSDDNPSLSLNLPLADAVTALATSLQNNIINAAPLNSMDILQWPGVLQSTKIDPEELIENANILFNDCLSKHIDSRQTEGKALAAIIEQRLHALDSEVTRVREMLPDISLQHERKLRLRLDALAVDIDSDRLAQELAYLAQKNDVAEELDRLDTHIAEVKKTLKQKGAIGRRLDFLMQELNREANTLSSKSISAETTQSAVDIKVLIEQMREQIQNIE